MFTGMFTHKLLYTVAAVALLGVLATAPAGAVFNSHRTTYLTFSKPFGLPGVSLPAGTYTFELPDPDAAWNLVRVLSRDHHKVYYAGFTQIIQRPAGTGQDVSIVFGEAPTNIPTPVKAWYPQDEQTGRQFIY